MAEYLEGSGARFASNTLVKPVFDLAAEFVLTGGKRIRPRLCLASYRILSKQPDPPTWALQAACCFELFHAFMLVHDDLIDGSTLRRNGLSLHEGLRRISPAPDSLASRKRAADLGLVAGDILCALGTKLLGQAGLTDAMYAQASALMSDILLESGVGQTLDIIFDTTDLATLTEAQILDAYVRKTSRYSVAGPLVLGGILAGAGEPVLKALGEYGDLLGLGYQLQNDLDALEHDPSFGGDHPDLDGGKRTWVLWKAYNHLDLAGQKKLLETLAEPVSQPRRVQLRRLLELSGAIDAGHSQLKTWREQAGAALRVAALTRSQQRSLLGLIEMLPGRMAVAPQPVVPDLSPSYSSGLIEKVTA